MQLDPEIAQKISKMPEGKDFMAFLASEILKLNALDNIELNDPIELSIEVKSRQRAYETLTKILEPLIFTGEHAILKASPKEYQV